MLSSTSRSNKAREEIANDQQIIKRDGHGLHTSCESQERRNCEMMKNAPVGCEFNLVREPRSNQQDLHPIVPYVHPRQHRDQVWQERAMAFKAAAYGAMKVWRGRSMSPQYAKSRFQEEGGVFMSLFQFFTGARQLWPECEHLGHATLKPLSTDSAISAKKMRKTAGCKLPFVK